MHHEQAFRMKSFTKLLSFKKPQVCDRGGVYLSLAAVHRFWVRARPLLWFAVATAIPLYAAGTGLCDSPGPLYEIIE